MMINKFLRKLKPSLLLFVIAPLLGYAGPNKYSKYLDRVVPFVSPKAMPDRTTESIEQVFDEGAGAWVNNEKEIFRFTSTFLVDSKITQIWNNNAWENYKLHAFVYDNRDNQIEETIYNWNVDKWISESYFTSTWSGQGDLTEKIEHIAIPGGVWDKFERTVYLRTPPNNWYANETRSEYWYGTSWDAYERINTTFDAQTALREEITQTNQVPDWVNKERTRLWYTGPGNYLQLIEIDTWSNDQWNPATRLNYQFSASSKIDQVIEEGYNTATSQWDEKFRVDWVYNGSDDLSQWNVDEFKNGGWQGYIRTNYTLVPEANITSIHKKSTDLGFIINSQSNVINLSWKPLENGNISASLFDMEGNKISNWKGSLSKGGMNLRGTSIQSLGTGIYYLRINSSIHGTSQYKFLKSE